MDPLNAILWNNTQLLIYAIAHTSYSPATLSAHIFRTATTNFVLYEDILLSSLGSRLVTYDTVHSNVSLISLPNDAILILQCFKAYYFAIPSTVSMIRFIPDLLVLGGNIEISWTRQPE